jgi:hypothetical protein
MTTETTTDTTTTTTAPARAVTYHRQQLAAALVATSTKPYHPNMRGVQVRPDGSVAATDSHMAVIVKQTHAADAADFPIVPNGSEMGPLTGPAFVETDTAKRLIAGADAKSPIPILHTVRIGTTPDGRTEAHATDLRAPVVATIPEPSGATFPNLAPVYQATEHQPTVRLVLSRVMLEHLAKIAKTIATNPNGMHAVTFDVPTDGPEVLTAVRVTMRSSDFEVDGVVMPCRG